MDPASSPLGRMLLDEISPVVMVLRTPLVEESCQKNGLSLIDMLRPFTDFSNIDVPVRTSSDQPYRLRKFRLRLFYESEIQQPKFLAVKERLKNVVSRAGDEISEIFHEPPTMTNVSLGSTSEASPSWFGLFNKELIRSVSFSEHEAFDHPVACLLVVSSKDAQPINRFVDLFNTNKLPKILIDGTMDPKIFKFFLLLHDNNDESSEKTTKILSDMKNTFGTNDCKVLCINSSHGALIEHQGSTGALSNNGGLYPAASGSLLSTEDLNEIRSIMQELASKHIIPNIEQKVRLLNQQVSATRKGFRNQIKNLWWRKGKEELTDTSNTYTYSSIESQIRVLGDYAFILQDYELALSNYRLISTDYKLDKAWKHYAGVQEMMGLSMFMLDQSPKEAEYCMDNALATYLKMVPSGHPNAMRCGLWWVDMLKAKNQYKDAASVYFRICGEDYPMSSVILEQASYCYLLSEPPMLNKYGFHLVLSGDHYKKCDQIKHAIRTYRSALSVYRGTTWSFIKDHMYFYIGQWYGYLGMYDVAAEHLLEVVACTHQSRTMQDLILRDFFQIVQKSGKLFELSRVQLPVVNVSSVRVVFEDHRTYGSPSAARLGENVWLSLEQAIIPSLPSAKGNWLELQTRLLPRRYRETSVCVAGEQIKVDMEFTNPLQVPICATSISLLCRFSTSGSEELIKDDSASCSDALHDRGEGETGCSGLFTVTEVELALGGEKTNAVQLAVTPLVEGTLKIIGVRWKLSGSVSGFYSFESELVKKTSGKRKLDKRYPLSKKLEFAVIKFIPKVEGSIDGFPEVTYSGALKHLVLSLKNMSEVPVKNLKMKLSHPSSLIMGSQNDVNLEFPSCLEMKDGTEQSSSHATTGNFRRSVFSFPEDVCIHKDKPLLWPLWFRAGTPGTVSVCMVIYYEIGDISNVMKYRTLRMTFNFQVRPSLEVSLMVTPFPSKLEEFLVRMDVVNKSCLEKFKVMQLSSVGKQWQLSLLQPSESIFRSSSLVPQQALCCFLNLKRCRKRVDTTLFDQENWSNIGSNVMTTSGDCNTFDICKSPLFDFHWSEKSKTEKSEQDSADSVDFILMSQLVGDAEKEPYPPTLFSHHICHCPITGGSPISWVLDGPTTHQHDFSSSICQINFQMTLYNSSESAVSITILAIDTPITDQSSDQPSSNSDTQTGWHPVLPMNDLKITTSSLTNALKKRAEIKSPFIWSGCVSTKIELEPLASAQVPLQITVFAPAIYNISNYLLNWNFISSANQDEREGKRQVSGTCRGYPYHLIVQSQ